MQWEPGPHLYCSLIDCHKAAFDAALPVVALGSIAEEVRIVRPDHAAPNSDLAPLRCLEQLMIWHPVGDGSHFGAACWTFPDCSARHRALLSLAGHTSRLFGLPRFGGPPSTCPVCITSALNLVQFYRPGVTFTPKPVAVFDSLEGPLEK